jgi:hypothetical protein
MHFREIRRSVNDAIAVFRDAGNRFYSPRFDQVDWSQAWRQAELVVIRALVQAYREVPGTSVFFEARDASGPVDECADAVVSSPEIGFVVVEVKAHRLDGLTFRGGRLCATYRDESKPIAKQVARAHEELRRLVSSHARCGPVPGSWAIALPNVSRCQYRGASPGPVRRVSRAA